MALGNRRRKKTREAIVLVKQVALTGKSVGETSEFDFNDLQNAINNTPEGTRLSLDSITFTGNIVIDKKIYIQGSGSGTVINGTITFEAGSSGSMLKGVKINDNITVNDTVKNLNISDCWLATGKTLTDNNSNTDDSLYLLLEEV